MYRIPRFARLAAGLAAILLVPLVGVTGVAAQPADETPGAGGDPPSALADLGADIEVNPLPSEPEYVPDELAVTLKTGYESVRIPDLLDTEVDVRDERSFGKRHRGVTVDPAELDEALELLSASAAVARVERVPVMWAQGAPVVPNDPLWAEQWGPRQVRVDQAWATTTGSSDIVVAIVDTGVNEVPDLSGRVLAGWNFVDGNDNPYDGAGHGTAVASVAAGTAGNGVAGAGVCQQCLILPVKVLGDNGSGSTLDIAAGIDWAVKKGADIINLSLGGPDTLPELDAAVAAAEKAGVLVVASAGNNGDVFDSEPRPPSYPAAYRTVLSVGANTQDGRRMSFSNHGPHVDVAAPGCDYAYNGQVEGRFCGTSFSSPMVAGVAALAMSQTPGLSPEDWREQIKDTSVGIGDWLLAGRVDALALLARGDIQPPTAGITAPADGTTLSGEFTVTAEARDNYGVRWAELLVDGAVIGSRLERAPFEWSLWAGSLTSGWHELTVRAGDGTSQTVSDSVRILVGTNEPLPPPRPAPPPGYTFTDLGVLSEPNEGFNEVEDLSDAGHVVGRSINPVPARHAYLWQDGALTDLGTLGEERFASGALGVNDHGHVVGFSDPSISEALHAFVYRDGRMTDLGTGYGSGSVSLAYDINNDGLIAGTRSDASAPPRTYEAVIWENGQIRPLGVLGKAYAVNTHGHVVGEAQLADGAASRGFLWQDDANGGSAIDLGSLGGDQAIADDINDQEQVVGTSRTADGSWHAFVWENGSMTRLGVIGEPNEPLDSLAARAWGINNSGQVVGETTVVDPVLFAVWRRAVLWDDGNAYDLNDLVANLPEGVRLVAGRATNDEKAIVARYCDSLCNHLPRFDNTTAERRSALLTPTGAPATLRTTLLSGAQGRETSSLATAEFIANDPAATFECSLDGAPFAPCASPYPMTGLALGSHTFRVRSVNDLEPESALVQRTWTIVEDNTPPHTTINQGPSGIVESSSAMFRFTSPDTDVVRFECSLDNAEFTVCSSPINYRKLSLAWHTFRVRAIDQAGNVDPTPATREWYVR
jgi:probable HAF family extracellular repeat protein